MKQGTNGIEDIKTVDKDVIGKEPIDRPTESINPWRTPSIIEVPLNVFYIYQNYKTSKIKTIRNTRTDFLHAHFTNTQKKFMLFRCY